MMILAVYSNFPSSYESFSCIEPEQFSRFSFSLNRSNQPHAQLLEICAGSESQALCLEHAVQLIFHTAVPSLSQHPSAAGKCCCWYHH